MRTDSIKKMMAIIDKHREQIPEGALIELCNGLKDVYDDANSVAKTGDAVTYENTTGHFESIRRDAFIELDSYIYHVNVAMDYDTEYFAWFQDVKAWMVDGNTGVPEKYHKRCTELFLAKRPNANYIPMGSKSYTFEGLREYGFQMNQDDETLYKLYFAQLGTYYDQLISGELYTADYYWDELCKTHGHEHLLRFIDQGARSTFWRQVWNLEKSSRVHMVKEYAANVPRAIPFPITSEDALEA